MHLPPLIQDLALILGTAGVVAVIFKRIGVSVVLGYLIAGVLVGPNLSIFPTVREVKNIQVLGELGVIFLLFALGLEFSFRKLLAVGGRAAAIGVAEISFLMCLGFLTGRMMGFSQVDSIFLAAIVSISSTSVVFKALEEMGLKTRRFTEVVYGVLIIEDLAAVLLLIAISAFAATRSVEGMSLLVAGSKILFIVPVWVMAGLFVLPTVLNWMRRFASHEVTVIFTVGLCLLMVLLSSALGFSAALAAFITGAILAETQEGKRIEEMTAALRHVFGAIFFVSIGMLFQPQDALQHGWAILLIALVVVVGKITANSLMAWMMGHTVTDAVRTGFSLAQIGEFSFIMATIGITAGVASPFLMTIAVSVSAIGIMLTPVLIGISDEASRRLERMLPEGWLRRETKKSGPLSATTGLRFQVSQGALKWFLNATIILAAFVLTRKYLPEGSSLWVGFLVAAVVSLPFVWGLFTAFGEAGAREFLSRWLVVVLSRGVTAVFLGVVSAYFLPIWIAFGLTSALLITVSLVAMPKLARTYSWLESRVVGALGEKERDARARAIRKFAPWEAHLSELQVHAESSGVGQTLKEMNFRGRFGVNVVVIVRGGRTLVAPGADDRVLPGDTLCVVGSDAQLERLEHSLAPRRVPEEQAEVGDFHLKRFTIVEGASLIGQTIRDCGLRERYGALVVGVERAEQRFENPDSGMCLEQGDALWIVSKKNQLAGVEGLK